MNFVVSFFFPLEAVLSPVSKYYLLQDEDRLLSFAHLKTLRVTSGFILVEQQPAQKPKILRTLKVRAKEILKNWREGGEGGGGGE